MNETPEHHELIAALAAYMDGGRDTVERRYRRLEQAWEAYKARRKA